jgi:peptidoglycan/LPS O-acetylase OafA/YrhL
MLAAVWRQAFEPDDARRASLGALLVGLGLMHLMMRRHVRRAALAVGALGVGLELLTASARAADVAHEGPPAGSALLAALLVITLVTRIADGRERYAGSAFVSDAHELQD